jgi:hypothetical protein
LREWKVAEIVNRSESKFAADTVVFNEAPPSKISLLSRKDNAVVQVPAKGSRSSQLTGGSTRGEGIRVEQKENV